MRGALAGDRGVKRPAFQFYPADWRKDTALQLCSIGARGLWWEMICLMHEADPYGHLVTAGTPVEASGLARLVGESPKDVKRWLDELAQGQVFSVTPSGIIFSRRMVRDQKERTEWAERQRKHRDKQSDVTPPVTQEVTTPVKPVSRLSASASSSAIQGLARTTGDARGRPPKNQSGEISPFNGKTKPKPGWHRSEAGIIEAGKALGINALPGETTQAYKARLFDAMRGH